MILRFENKKKMARLIYCCLFITVFIMIQPYKTFCSDNEKYGINASYSFQINQYYKKPKTGETRSFGIFYILATSFWILCNNNLDAT